VVIAISGYAADPYLLLHGIWAFKANAKGE